MSITELYHNDSFLNECVATVVDVIEKGIIYYRTVVHLEGRSRAVTSEFRHISAFTDENTESVDSRIPDGGIL